MVIDTSAIIAILLKEPEAVAFSMFISNDARLLMSAVSALEAAIVIEAKKGEAGGRELDLLLHRSQIEIVPMNVEQYESARIAWRLFGKGNHPAGLNIGDCCAYALSKYSNEPLLYKGHDFSLTDITSAVGEQDGC